MNAAYKIFRYPFILVRIFHRSLLQRVIATQFLILVVFCVIVSVNLLWQFNKIEGGELDKALPITARAIANTLQASAKTPDQVRLILDVHDKVSREIYEISQQENGQAIARFEFVARVINNEGQQIYITTPHPPALLDAFQLGSRSLIDAGREWRILTHRAPGSNLIVQVAQTTGSMNEDIESYIARYIFYPLAWFIPLAALVAYFATIKGLQPLRQLASVIAQRNPDDMRPLTNVASYTETQPLVNEINFLLQKLETTLQRERDFLADAAHELRTPLAVIQTQVHVLKHADTDVAKSAASDELNNGIERAASLIHKLLLTAKMSVDNFKPRFETVDLTAFVQERVTAFAELAARKNIDIELDAPRSCSVVADRETFISAVDNVLDNAIRYTPEGGRIQVHIALLGTDKVRLRIDDNGAGIAPDLYERVFERFYRVGGTDQQGSGLGLAIVKRVLALHGGEVALSPGLSQRGLSVALTLPTGA
jgi:signal transduction histidine kinase